MGKAPLMLEAKNHCKEGLKERRVDTFRSIAIHTPAYIFDEQKLLIALRIVGQLTNNSGAQTLYSLKACAIPEMLNLIAKEVQGFSCSSLFEVRLARDVIGCRGTVHLTTPGLRPDEIDAISESCDYVTLNSLSQWERFKGLLSSKKVRCGLRVNPNLSFVRDERYDPCRRHSKLGVPLEQIKEFHESDPKQLNGITGLHIHANCDSDDFGQLLDTVKHLEANLWPILNHVEWINLGGGYFFDEGNGADAFHDAVDLLQAKYELEVFVEPGAPIMRKAGSLVSTVIDLFDSDGKEIAVLDTTVNHMPEVFEYQYEPDVVGHKDDGSKSYILAGCTCLSGDVFGEYSFDESLEIGSRVVIANAGAYSFVKAHMFNGVNLPSIYRYSNDGKLSLSKKFGYDDFKSLCGETANASL